METFRRDDVVLTASRQLSQPSLSDSLWENKELIGASILAAAAVALYARKGFSAAFTEEKNHFLDTSIDKLFGADGNQIVKVGVKDGLAEDVFQTIVEKYPDLQGRLLNRQFFKIVGQDAKISPAVRDLFLNNPNVLSVYSKNDTGFLGATSERIEGYRNRIRDYLGASPEHPFE